MTEIIRGFPEHIREVPEDRVGWLRWRRDVLAFREFCHRQAERDPEKRAAIMRLAANDPAFFVSIFGVLIEPRSVKDMDVDADGNVVDMRRPRGWYPWCPYPFQVRMLRTIDEALATDDDDTGKGDLVVEKSRDIGATWVFCAHAAHLWLTQEDVIIGLYSHKEDVVDSGSHKSMFYKIRALIGANPSIPERCHAPGTIFDGARLRLPAYLRPSGMEKGIHDKNLYLKHPTKANEIFGEATTGKSGIGSRTTYNIIDEGAKFDKPLLDIWSGMGAVTDHRFALSSADRRFGDGMYQLVEQARASLRDPSVPGPRLLSLPWWVIPLRDEEWEVRERGRYAADPAGFEREYLVNWNAGQGDWVYPIAQNIIPGEFPYDPALGQVYCTIDPGIRDETAIEWFQHEPGRGRYRLFDALVLKTHSAAYLAPILMGWPPGHELRENYRDASLQEIMDLMWEIRSSGREITYVGDPYGDNVGGANSDSYYTVLWQTSEDLSNRYHDLPRHEIMVLTKYDEGARYHQGRKEALTKLIPLTDFHNIPRVRHVVEAMKNYRYKGQDPTRLVQNEPQKPAHDWSSHPTTAAEFFAVIAQINDLTSGEAPKPFRSGRKARGSVRPTPPGYTSFAPLR